jgi:hypothetical protein
MTTDPEMPEQPPQPYPPMTPPQATPPAATSPEMSGGMPPNLPSDIDDKWKEGGPAKGVRVRLPLAIAVIAVVALVGIWGGAQLKGNKASANVATSGQGQGNRGFRGYGGNFPGRGEGGTGGGGFGNATAGTVQSVNGNTITLTDRQGQTQTVTLTPNATITKTTTGSVSDITAGQNVVVRQITNSDGSTSQVVSVGNDALGGGFFGGGGPGGGGQGNGSSTSSGN